MIDLISRFRWEYLMSLRCVQRNNCQQIKKNVQFKTLHKKNENIVMTNKRFMNESTFSIK